MRERKNCVHLQIPWQDWAARFRPRNKTLTKWGRCWAQHRLAVQTVTSSERSGLQKQALLSRQVFLCSFPHIQTRPDPSWGPTGLRVHLFQNSVFGDKAAGA